MRSDILQALILILVCCLAYPLAAADSQPATDDPAAGILLRLRSSFVERLADPPAYQKLIERECRGFPEGDLFPYTFIAMALARTMPVDPAAQTQQRQAIVACLDAAIASVVRKTKAPRRDLLQLDDYAKHGTYLGGLALALPAWRVAGGDDRYDALEDHCCDLLAAALSAAHGAQIASFPTYTWTFDTIPALVAVCQNDRRRSLTRGADLLRAHLAWLQANASDAATGLPASVVVDGKVVAPPRGCDLSWRIALLHGFDATAAAAVYKDYHRHFWHDRLAYAGFREFPVGVAGVEDRDSGPIFDGLGLTATGFGIAAARVTGDAATEKRLLAEVAVLPQLRQLMAMQDPAASRKSLGHLKDDPAYVSGFLFGDICCFYAMSWPAK